VCWNTCRVCCDCHAAPHLASLDGKPVPTTGTAQVFRAFTRDLAAGRRAWDTVTARFINGQFDELAAAWEPPAPPGAKMRCATA
jgi:hypothetical protein